MHIASADQDVDIAKSERYLYNQIYQDNAKGLIRNYNIIITNLRNHTMKEIKRNTHDTNQTNLHILVKVIVKVYPPLEAIVQQTKDLTRSYTVYGEGRADRVRHLTLLHFDNFALSTPGYASLPVK